MLGFWLVQRNGLFQPPVCLVGLWAPLRPNPEHWGVGGEGCPAAALTTEAGICGWQGRAPLFPTQTWTSGRRAVTSIPLPQKH